MPQRPFQRSLSAIRPPNLIAIARTAPHDNATVDALQVDSHVNVVVASSVRMLGIVLRITREFKIVSSALVAFNCVVHSNLGLLLYCLEVP